MNRSEINRCLAKAMAYKQCGKDQAAAAWAIRLVRALELENILEAGAISVAFRGEERGL